MTDTLLRQAIDAFIGTLKDSGYTVDHVREAFAPYHAGLAVGRASQGDARAAIAGATK